MLTSDIPPAPEGEPPLPLPLLAIWELVGRQRPIPEDEQVQIKMLIDRYRQPTDGYSAYWLGRVMLFADMCRKEHETVKLKLINSYMNRMAEAGFTTEALENRNYGAERGSTADRSGVEPRGRRSRVPSLPSKFTVAHPAIDAYTAAFGRAPNDVQAAQIVATVTDLEIWQRVLTEWQANGWKEAAVAKMLDRYRKEAGLVSSNEPERPPRSSYIHDYPGLTSDERSDWLLRFHRAETPDAKRAVLARLAQEHPRELGTEEQRN
jgi:hypothetical protein